VLCTDATIRLRRTLVFPSYYGASRMRLFIVVPAHLVTDAGHPPLSRDFHPVARPAVTPIGRVDGGGDLNGVEATGWRPQPSALLEVRHILAHDLTRLRMCGSARCYWLIVWLKRSSTSGAPNGNEEHVSEHTSITQRAGVAGLLAESSQFALAFARTDVALSMPARI
jgi:hypothetical protein